MRALLGPVAALMLFSGIPAANAAIAITVNKDLQEMTVSVDGVPRYHWPISSGNPSHETPNGKFQAFRMEEDHYSKEFDDAPMPHSIFFTKQGHAIHGTDSVRSLGMPVSHGCVRLSRPNDMAKFVLEGKKGWTEARMNKVLAKGAETDVPIDRSMAVYIMYFTAWLDDKNNLVYEDDIYGEDRKLLGVMARSGSYWLPESKITNTAQAVKEIHTQLAAAY